MRRWCAGLSRLSFATGPIKWRRTKLTKEVRRSTEGIDRRPVVVTLYPNRTIGFRLLRCRREFTLPLARAYRMAVEATAEANRRARQEKRNEERKARGLTPRRRLVSRGLLRP